MSNIVINISDVYFCNIQGETIDITWEKAKNNNFKYFVFNKQLIYTEIFRGVVSEPFEFNYDLTDEIQKKSQIENINVGEIYWADIRDKDLNGCLYNSCRYGEKFKYIFFNGNAYKLKKNTINGNRIAIKLERGTYTIDSSRIENYK